MMKALQLRELVGPSGLSCVDVDDPTSDELVHVYVQAAGVNLCDLLALFSDAYRLIRGC